MANYDITVIAGDGIGTEVTREAMRVLDAASSVYGFELRRNELPYGSEHYIQTEEIFPDDAFNGAKDTDAIYLGAIGDPRLPVGLIEYGIIAKCRFELDLYINKRPIKLYDERLCPLKDKTCDDVDMVIIRENTEDAYTGMHGFAHKGQSHEVSTQTMVYTRVGVERAIRYAFEKAVERDKDRRVTLID
ncbi:MAG: isocitrate/isopropylmalate family dehydrogenase, partial [Planctomycetes bacterium]|nr:isocitrate/isopropylmalate family dehydrogenase [Planctomycetota bacterium]